MTSRDRPSVLVYAQHLSGVGHYVRTYEIARSLTRIATVYWIEGGRSVPHRRCPELVSLPLPAVRRAADGRLTPVNSTRAIDSILRDRADRLLALVEALRPAVFLVEYFPFSKWELARELLPAIECARAHGCRILCSLRDIVFQTRHEACPASDYQTQVLLWLHQHFDALLVHGDPSLIRLGDTFPAADSISLPIFYTGIVSEKLRARPDVQAEIQHCTEGRPFVLMSAGGGGGDEAMLRATLEAWADSAVRRSRLLLICSSLEHGHYSRLRQLSRHLNDDVKILPFRDDFLHWLTAAEASISPCGYNTAANLLETQARAIVWPHPLMSDQRLRAECLHGQGLVRVAGGNCGTAELAAMLQSAEFTTMRQHNILLDGADSTSQIIHDLLMRA